MSQNLNGRNNQNENENQNEIENENEIENTRIEESCSETVGDAKAKRNILIHELILTADEQIWQKKEFEENKNTDGTIQPIIASVSTARTDSKYAMENQESEMGGLQWEILKGLELPTPRCAHSAAVLCGVIHVFGGFTGEGGITDVLLGCTLSTALTPSLYPVGTSFIPSYSSSSSSSYSSCSSASSFSSSASSFSSSSSSSFSSSSSSASSSASSSSSPDPLSVPNTTSSSSHDNSSSSSSSLTSPHLETSSSIQSISAINTKVSNISLTTESCCPPPPPPVLIKRNEWSVITLQNTRSKKEIKKANSLNKKNDIGPRFGHAMCPISASMKASLNQCHSTLVSTSTGTPVPIPIKSTNLRNIDDKLSVGLLVFGGVSEEKDFGDVWLLDKK